MTVSLVLTEKLLKALKPCSDKTTPTLVIATTDNITTVLAHSPGSIFWASSLCPIRAYKNLAWQLVYQCLSTGCTIRIAVVSSVITITIARLFCLKMVPRLNSELVLSSLLLWINQQDSSFKKLKGGSFYHHYSKKRESIVQYKKTNE